MKLPTNKSKKKKKGKFRIGLAPGALVFTGDQKIDTVAINILPMMKKPYLKKKLL
jgi:hypothetical protein